MRTSVSALALAFCAAVAAPAQAQFAVTADLGTTGVGAHLVLPMEASLNGRFGINAFKFSKNGHESSVDYELKTSLQSIDLLFDWYPITASALRVTAGVVYNNNGIDVLAKPGADGNYLLNEHVYTAADVGKLSGGLNFRKASPYLGIGWGNPLTSTSNWSLTADLGVFFQGKANASLAAIGCAGEVLVCFLLPYDVAVEKERLVASLSPLKVYPVLRVGASYRF